MSRIRALIADGHAPTRSVIHRLLEEDEEIRVLAECVSGEQAVLAIQETSPDALFLGAELPDMTGFELLAEIGRGQVPWVVLLAAEERDALRAFELHAADCLMMPVTASRLRDALAHLKEEIRRADAVAKLERLRAILYGPPVSAEGGHGTNPPAPVLASVAGQDGAPAEAWAPSPRPTEVACPILVKRGGRTLLIRPEEVDWLEAAGCYVRLHVGERSYLHRSTMCDLASRLVPLGFFRIHRSYLVRIDCIQELRRREGEHVVVLQDGDELPLSRRRRPALLATLSDRA